MILRFLKAVWRFLSGVSRVISVLVPLLFVGVFIAAFSLSLGDAGPEALPSQVLLFAGATNVDLPGGVGGGGSTGPPPPPPPSSPPPPPQLIRINVNRKLKYFNISLLIVLRF